MKKFITSMFAMATLLTASAQMASGVQARVYAYNLQQEVDTESKDVTSYKITFQTNCAANEGEAFVLLMQDGEEVYRIPAEATDNTLKNWEAVVDVYTVQEIAGNVEAGDYNWSVEVAAGAVSTAGLSLISDNSSSLFGFFRPTAVAVDNSPESDYFGRVYVTNTSGSAMTVAPKRTAEVGLYAYSPELIALNDGSPIVGGYGTTDAEGTIGYKWNGTSSTMNESGTPRSTPRDMAVGGDGRIYLGIFAHEVSGVLVIDPSDVSNRTMLATGGTRNSTTGYYVVNSKNVVGRVSGIGVRGGYENTQLYVTDYSNTFNSSGTEKYNPLAVARYDLGTEYTWSVAPTWKASSFTNENKTSSNSATSVIYGEWTSIDPVKNGFWAATQVFTKYPTDAAVVQDHRYTPLFYYSEKTGKVEWEIMYQLPDLKHTFSTTYALGALAVSEELGLVAYSEYNSTNAAGSRSTARILKYSENEDGTLNVSYVGDYTLTEQGNHHTAFDFDHAGNLYAVTNNRERLSVFALSDAIVGENKRVTPAKSDLLVKLTAEDITTGIVEVGVDADAAVEYYNLQGVKVENPSNGIFIKKQGNKATKVVL